MQCLEVSVAVRHIYVIRRLKVNLMTNRRIILCKEGCIILEYRYIGISRCLTVLHAVKRTTAALILVCNSKWVVSSMPGQLIPRERASFVIWILGRMDSKALRTVWRKPSVISGNETLIACSFIPYTSHCRLIT